MVCKIILLQGEPAISMKIKQWQKDEDIKKAATLKKSEFEGFLASAPNDAFYLTVKAVAIIAVSGLQRRSETTNQLW